MRSVCSSAQHLFDFSSSPVHSFPSGSARSDGFLIHLGLRDGAHARQTVVQERKSGGHFDVRETVRAHLYDAKSRPSKSPYVLQIKPWLVRHERCFGRSDRDAILAGQLNVRPSEIVRPAFAFAVGRNELAPDPHADVGPRSLAPRSLGQRAQSPWAGPSAPPDRLSLAARADRATGRHLRSSKFLGAEKTSGGMPWSLRRRSTKNFSLDDICAELKQNGIQDARALFDKAAINVMGARRARWRRRG